MDFFLTYKIHVDEDGINTHNNIDPDDDLVEYNQKMAQQIGKDHRTECSIDHYDPVNKIVTFKFTKETGYNKGPYPKDWLEQGYGSIDMVYKDNYYRAISEWTNNIGGWGNFLTYNMTEFRLR